MISQIDVSPQQRVINSQELKSFTVAGKVLPPHGLHFTWRKVMLIKLKTDFHKSGLELSLAFKLQRLSLRFGEKFHNF